MPETTDILHWLNENAFILIIIVGVLFAFYWLAKKNKGDKYKPVVLAKELKKYMKELFSLAEIKKINRPLFRGSEENGYVIAAFKVPFKESLSKSLEAEKKYKSSLRKIKKEMLDHPEVVEFYNKQLEELKNEYKKKTADKEHDIVIMKVISKKKLKRFVQKAFNEIGLEIGVHYLIINDSQILIDATGYYISWKAKPSNYLGIWVFDNPSKKYIDDVVYKINSEQQLDSMVNYLPKLSYHDLEQSKNKAALEFMAEQEKAKRKALTDELKKGN